MRKFDTKIQYLKYQVLREVAKHAFDGTLLESFNDIAKVIVKDKPTMRCCIYKERAIVAERIKLATGGDKSKLRIKMWAIQENITVSEKAAAEKEARTKALIETQQNKKKNKKNKKGE